MSQTNNQQSKEEQYIAKVKEFVSSEAWREYLRPILNNALQGDLPKPNEKGWEEKYRYYFALATAFSMFINALENTANREEFLKEVAKQTGLPIDEA